jgi:hypothetical protein
MNWQLAPAVALNRLIGILFLIWSFFAGGYLLRYLLLGNSQGIWHDVFGHVLGVLTVIVLIVIWRKIAETDRAYIVKVLWGLALIVSIKLWLNW